MTSALGFYKRLREAGVDEATAVLCAEQFEQEVKVAVDAILEPRRAKDRARKAKLPQNSVESVETPESEESAEAPLSRPLPPQTPLTPTHSPVVCVSTRARGDDDFERFWTAYPRKTAKDVARKAFPRALGKASVETMLAALERQREWEQWRRGIVPHPATWLNQSRWTDEDPEIQPLSGHERSHHDPRQAAREDSLRAHHAGAMAAVNRRLGSVG